MKNTAFSGRIHQISCQGLLDLMNEKNTAFSGRPWNPVDFMWNLADFMHEIQWISCQGLIHYIYICIGSHEWKKIQHSVVDHEIWWISWNLANFIMKSGRFHPWNLADFMADLEKCKLENVKFYNAYNFSSM